MYSCEQFEMLVSAWIDGDLSEAEQAALAEHAASCPRCQQYQNDQIALHAAFAGLEANAPAGFCASVMERVRTTPQDKPEKKVIAFPAWRRRAAAAACCAVVALGVWAAGLQKRTATDAMVSYKSASAESFSLYGAETAPAAAAPAKFSMPESADGDILQDNAACDTAVLAAPEAPAEAVEDSAAPEAPAAAAGENAAGTLRADFACCLTTGSEAAKIWLETVQGETWVADGIYPVTADRYEALKTLLTDAGELFTEETGTGTLYLIQAQ